MKETVDTTEERTSKLIKSIKDDIVNKFIVDEFKAKHNVDSLKLNKEINDVPPFIATELLKYRRGFSVLIDDYTPSSSSPSSPQRAGSLASMLRSPKSSGASSETSNKQSVRNQMRANVTSPLVAEGKSINDEITKEFVDSTEKYCGEYGKKKEEFSTSISRQNADITREIEELLREISLTLIRRDRTVPRAPEYVLRECLPSMSEAATKLRETKSLEAVNVIRSSTPLANKLAKVIEPRAIDLTTVENIPVPVPVEETMGEIIDKYNTSESVKLLYETGIDTTEVDIKKETPADGKEKELPDFDFSRYSYVYNFNPEELERGRKMREKLNKRYNDRTCSTLATPRRVTDFEGESNIPCASSSAMIGDVSYEHNEGDNALLNKGADFNVNIDTPRRESEKTGNKQADSSDLDFVDNYTREDYMSNTTYYKNKEDALNSMCLGEIKRESERLKPFVSPRYIDPENKAYKTDLDMLYLSIKNGKYGKGAAASANTSTTSTSKPRSSSLTKSRQRQTTTAMLQSRIKARQAAQRDEDLLIAVPYSNKSAEKKTASSERVQQRQKSVESNTGIKPRSASRLSSILSPRPSTGSCAGRVSVAGRKPTGVKRPPTQGASVRAVQREASMKVPEVGVKNDNVSVHEDEEIDIEENNADAVQETEEVLKEKSESNNNNNNESNNSNVDEEKRHRHRHSHHSSTSSSHSHRKHSKSKHEKTLSPSKIPVVGSVSVNVTESVNNESVEGEEKVHRSSSSSSSGRRTKTPSIVRLKGTRPADAE